MRHRIAVNVVNVAGRLLLITDEVFLEAPLLKIVFAALVMAQDNT
ncbi:MAG: hypothetical protein ACREWG_16545 [Gammaproteobacteria bacterium]